MKSLPNTGRHTILVTGLSLIVSAIIVDSCAAADKKPSTIVAAGHSTFLSGITYVQFSPDGKLVLTGGEDGRAIVWSVETGQPVRVLETNAGTVICGTLGETRSRVVSGAFSEGLTIWDLNSGQRLRKIESDVNPLATALSADCSKIVTSSPRRSGVTVWDAPTGESLQTIEAPKVWKLGLSDDGNTLFTFNTRSKTSSLWDVKTGKLLHTLEGHQSLVESIAISANGKRAVTGSADETAILWDCASGDILQTFHPEAKDVCAVALSSDGNLVLTGTLGSALVLWDGKTGKRLRSLDGHKEQLDAVALSSDGTRAVSVSRDGVIICWSTENGKELQRLSSAVHSVYRLAVSNSGERMIAGFYDRQAVLWDLGADEACPALLETGYPLRSVAITGDGKHGATADLQKAVTWDLETRKQVQIIKQDDQDDIQTVDLSKDGKSLLVGSFAAGKGKNEGRAIVYDVESGKPIHKLEPARGRILAGRFVGSENAFVTCTSRRATLWDLGTGKPLRVFEPKFMMHCLALTSDGKELFTSGDQTILWETETGKQLQVFEGQKGDAIELALSDDGKTIVTVSLGARVATIWDRDTAKPARCQLKSESLDITRMALSADGKRLFTASSDGSIRIWATATGEEVCKLISVNSGDDWVVVTREGYFDGSAEGRKFVRFQEQGDTKLVSSETYTQLYYRPGLLRKLLRETKP